MPCCLTICKTFILFFLIILVSATECQILGQQKVAGVVSDNDGSPLYGVTVSIKGISTATRTDSSGAYSITAPSGSSILFSYVGHETREIKISNNFQLSLVLPTLVTNLSEVVVTAYGSEQVKDITGAVSIVKPKELTAVPAGQVEPMLQGRAAGVNVITQATPGAPTLISIHGFGNFGLVTPLYIIDGTPGNINDLNPDDIESLQVLKDAGSAAIYGVRGANGAIVVTTRKGKPGNATITFENYLGYQVPLSKGYDVLNPTESAEATWQAYTNSGIPLVHPQYKNTPGSNIPILPYYVLAGSQGGLAEGDPAADPKLYNADPLAGPIYQIVKANQAGTDWFHQLYSPAFSQNYTLTASGGGDKNRYLFSLGYMNQEGTLINTYLKRFTVRINTEFNILKNIRIGENLELLSKETPDEDAPENPGTGGSASISLANPILPPYDIEGNQYGGVPGLGPPAPVFAYLDSRNSKRFNWAALGNVYAEVDFASHFTFRTSFGGTFNYNYYYVYQPSFPSLGGSAIANSLTEGSGYGHNWSWQNTLLFQKTFHEDNQVKLLIGTEFIDNYGRNLSGSGGGFYSNAPNYTYLSNSD